jgi:hypothetical protein
VQNFYNSWIKLFLIGQQLQCRSKTWALISDQESALIALDPTLELLNYSSSFGEASEFMSSIDSTHSMALSSKYENDRAFAHVKPPLAKTAMDLFHVKPDPHELSAIQAVIKQRTTNPTTKLNITNYDAIPAVPGLDRETQLKWMANANVQHSELCYDNIYFQKVTKTHIEQY